MAELRRVCLAAKGCEMKYQGRIGAAATMTALLWAAAAQAQTDAPGRGSAASKARVTTPMFAAEAAATARPLEPQEREARRFLKEAAASSRFQVDAARLAASRSTNADVRSLAAALGAEHAEAGDELLRMLHQRGLAAPMMENAQRKTLTRLARLKGPKFDREYLAAAMGEMQEQADAGEKAGAQVQDPAIEGWIGRALPALRYQADTAGRLAASWHVEPARAGRPARQRISGSSIR